METWKLRPGCIGQKAFVPPVLEGAMNSGSGPVVGGSLEQGTEFRETQICPTCP